MRIKYLKNSRRDFLKKGMMGIAGYSLLPSFVNGESKVKTGKKKKSKKNFIYRTLGRTGIKVPIVSMGAANTGKPQLLRAALAEGIIHFDTAPNYRNGNSETILGEIFKGRPRDSFLIATKSFGLRDTRTGLIPRNISPAEYRADFHKRVEGSLKRLQLNYVDILYLHRAETPGLVGQKPIKDVMLELKKEGLVRWVGVSIHQNEPMSIRAAVDAKIYDVILTAYNFRQPHREEVKEAIDYAVKAGLGVIAMKTQAGVYWDKERKHPINMKAALKWVLQNENVHTTIPGITTFDQLELDLSVMADLTLTPREKADLQFGEKQATAGLYCAQCGRCRDRCRYNLDIPTVMRSYMYAYGYRNPAKAKETLSEKNPKEITCRSCTTCAVTCTMGFDVPGKVRDITRVLEVPDDFLVKK